jgi:hypothetical protein
MCFTVKSIVQATTPLLMVSRDVEDAGWSFLTGEPLDMSEALLVTLRSMVERDQTVLELADLPPGWTAVRSSPQASWTRAEDKISNEPA